MKCGVKRRNINASVLNEDERNQKAIHNPREGRPKAPREEGDEGVINPQAVATGGVDQRRRTLSR